MLVLQNDSTTYGRLTSYGMKNSVKYRLSLEVIYVSFYYVWPLGCVSERGVVWYAKIQEIKKWLCQLHVCRTSVRGAMPGGGAEERDHKCIEFREL